MDVVGAGRAQRTDATDAPPALPREILPGLAWHFKNRLPIFAYLAFLPMAAVADCAAHGAAAARFANAYVKHAEAVLDGRSRQGTVSWLKANALASPTLAAAYAAKEREGRKKDPELGWGADILLDAQDFPDKGFELQTCLATPGYVRLRGIDAPDFTLTLRVEDTPAGPRVIGSGMVNIPAKLRATR